MFRIDHHHASVNQVSKRVIIFILEVFKPIPSHRGDWNDSKFIQLRVLTRDTWNSEQVSKSCVVTSVIFFIFCIRKNRGQVRRLPSATVQAIIIMAVKLFNLIGQTQIIETISGVTKESYIHVIDLCCPQYPD